MTIMGQQPLALGAARGETKWLGPHHLLVRYAAKSRIFEQDEAVAGVKITYQQVRR